MAQQFEFALTSASVQSPFEIIAAPVPYRENISQYTSSLVLSAIDLLASSIKHEQATISYIATITKSVTQPNFPRISTLSLIPPGY